MNTYLNSFLLFSLIFSLRAMETDGHATIIAQGQDLGLQRPHKGSSVIECCSVTTQVAVSLGILAYIISQRKNQINIFCNDDIKAPAQGCKAITCSFSELNNFSNSEGLSTGWLCASDKELEKKIKSFESSNRVFSEIKLDGEKVLITPSKKQWMFEEKRNKCIYGYTPKIVNNKYKQKYR